MKKLFGTLFFLTFILSGLFAQHLKMEVTDIQAADPATAQQMEAIFKTMKLDIYHTDGVTVSNVDMMNGMSNTKVFYSPSTDKTIMYMDIMGQKIKVIPTEAEVKQMKAESEAKKPVIKKVDGDTKQIAGYNCQKYLVTNEGNTMELYVAPDLKIGTKTLQGMENIQLDGFPLEYTVDAAGNKITMTTTKVEKEVDNSKVTEPTGKYKEMNFADFKAQMGGMMGQ